MKKYVAILLAALIALTCTSALAETVRFSEDSDDFDIEMLLPEGAVVASLLGTEQTNMVRIDAEGLASVWIVVAYSEIYNENESMNDLSDDDILSLMEIAGIQFENPEMTILVTPSGNKYILVEANEESDSDMDSIFTLYKGYFIQLTQWHDDFAVLTEADTEFMNQLLYNIEFTDL